MTKSSRPAVKWCTRGFGDHYPVRRGEGLQEVSLALPTRPANDCPTPHPAGDGSPNLVRRIFLDEMNPRHRFLGQRWPPADEVDQLITGEDRTWLSLQEQLGHIARPQPILSLIHI